MMELKLFRLIVCYLLTAALASGSNVEFLKNVTNVLNSLLDRRNYDKNIRPYHRGALFTLLITTLK